MPEKKICLITNQAGSGELLFLPSRNGSKSHLHDIFETNHRSIFKILSPEHGISSQSESNGLETDNLLAANLSVLPAYHRSSEELAGLFDGCEAIYFDLPDAGVRPYTYRTILTRSAGAVSKMSTKPVIYLVDYPNPASFLPVAGPMVRKEFFSYLGEEEIPFFPHYTYAELLRYFLKKQKLDIPVKYIAMPDYKPGVRQVKKPFDPPSPSLPHPRSLHCYWVAIFLEGTGLDYGRHTKDPFCLVGHRQLDYKKEMPEIDGVRFSRYVYKPFSGPYQNQLLRGFKYEITDLDKYDPLKTAYEMLLFFINNYPEINLFPEGKNMILFDKITGSDSMRKSLQAKTSYRQWKWKESREIQKFKGKMQNYRMY